MIKINNLSEASKNIIKNYMVRNKYESKTNFINYIKSIYSEAYIESYDSKETNRNIIIGNLKDSKYVFTAHYDTCPTMFFVPNFITPMNIFIYLMYQILIGVLIAMIGVGIGFGLGYLLSLINENLYLIGYEFGLLLTLFIFLFQIRSGIPNKNNYNDNTSGVITIMELINKMPENLKNKCVFILFDNEEKGLKGSKAFKNKNEEIMKDKIVINLDCVSDGNNILLIHKNINDSVIESLNTYNSNDYNIIVRNYKKCISPSDHINFKKYIAVMALNKNKFLGYYVARIHTKNDLIFDENNIFEIVNLFTNLVENN